MAKVTMTGENGKYRAALAYVLGFFTAVPLLLKAGDDRFVRFHAWQSILWSVVVAGVVVQAMGWLAPDLRLLWLVIVIAYLLYGVVTVATGRDFRMPLIAGFVEKRLAK
jgi:uncharacterized membrane protein